MQVFTPFSLSKPRVRSAVKTDPLPANSVNAGPVTDQVVFGQAFRWLRDKQKKQLAAVPSEVGVSEAERMGRYKSQRHPDMPASVCKWLNEHGFSPEDLNRPSEKGYVPIVEAVGEAGSPKVLKYILNQPYVDVNQADIDGDTALSWAAYRNHDEAFWLLWNNRAKLHLNVFNQYNPNRIPGRIHDWFRKNGFDLRNINWPNGKGYLPIVEAVGVKGRLDVLLYCLQQRNLDLNRSDSDGDVAFSWAANQANLPAVEILLQDPRLEVNKPGRENATAVLRAAWEGHTKVVERILQHPGVDLSIPDIDGDTALTSAIRKKHHDIVRMLRAASPQQAVVHDFWKRTLPKLETAIKEKDEAPILRYLPALLLTMPLRVVRYVTYEGLGIDMTRNPSKWGFHPNEAEMLLLLRHPELISRDPKKTRYVSEGVTAITRFRNKTVSDAVYKAWADIGLLTHDFRLWRYDAVGGPNSLLAQYGFRVIADPEPHPFGSGFYRNMPDGTHVVFRRGFLLASHPERGTVLIRNSSTVFGRDLLERPAYYSPTAFTQSGAERFNPENNDVLNAQGFHHIIEPALYDNMRVDQQLSGLVTSLMNLKENYAQWKFNADGFAGEPDQPTFSLMFSPGLYQILEKLVLWQKQGKPLPDLAFCHPDYPPYQPFSRLPVNAQTTQELSRILEDNWDVSPQMINFIQTGVSEHAELVLLEPENNAAEKQTR
jgi:ankyrin repeat protein